MRIKCDLLRVFWLMNYCRASTFGNVEDLSCWSYLQKKGGMLYMQCFHPCAYDAAAINDKLQQGQHPRIKWVPSFSVFKNYIDMLQLIVI